MQQKSTISYFGGSIFFALAAMIGGYAIHGWIGVYEVLILGLLESTLSVDNAVLNAKQLKTMSHWWRRAFITIGMLIAVFGMRIAFPIVIVSIVTGLEAIPGLGPIFHNLLFWTFGSGELVAYGPNVLSMAINQPAQYSAALTSSHLMIAGFGGGFLVMVGLKFFIDAEKDTHWLTWIEKPLSAISSVLGGHEAIATVVRAGIAIAILYTLGLYTSAAHGGAHTFVISGLVGIGTYVAVDVLKSLLSKDEEESSTTSNIVQTWQAGLAGFIYLEILDASCSFDGVIGAFAITNDLFIIAMGLGIGAMIVRSLTILLVDRDTLSEYRYLEHGAMYAITSLAGIILASAVVEIPDAIAGGLGALFIGLALWSSVRYNRHEQAELATADAEKAAYKLEKVSPMQLPATPSKLIQPPIPPRPKANYYAPTRSKPADRVVPESSARRNDSADDMTMINTALLMSTIDDTPAPVIHHTPAPVYEAPVCTPSYTPAPAYDPPSYTSDSGSYSSSGDSGGSFGSD